MLFAKDKHSVRLCNTRHVVNFEQHKQCIDMLVRNTRVMHRDASVLQRLVARRSQTPGWG